MLRLALWRAVRVKVKKGEISRADARKVRLAIIANPVRTELDGTEITFDEEIQTALEAEGLVQVGRDGKIINAIKELVRMIIDNWSKIAPIILFIIGLF